MFKQERKEEDFSQLQKLLMMKRQELPPQSYFDGVLLEFHNRQRAQLLQPRYTLVSRLFDTIETLQELLTLRPILRYALASSVAIFLISAGLKMSWTDTPSSPNIAGDFHPALTEYFAFTQALEPRKVSTVDQQIDALSMGPVSLDNKPVLPHYVIAQAPTSYDKAMAF